MPKQIQNNYLKEVDYNFEGNKRLPVSNILIFAILVIFAATVTWDTVEVLQ